MYEEIKELAALALRNAFWTDFSALVNKYMEASDGLYDLVLQEARIGELTSVYGRDTEADSDASINIWVKINDYRTCGCSSLAEALEIGEAVEIHLQGTKIFERRDGEWYYAGD